MRMFIVLAAVSTCGLAHAQPLGTSFTYQGSLRNAGAPAQGVHDLRFRLYDAASGGNQVGATLCADNVGVADGLFTTTLDFGAVFGGSQRFLEIDVRPDAGLGCANATGFVTLSPRQPVSAAPNALFSLVSSSAGNATQLGGLGASFYTNAANLSAGTLPDARLATTVARTNVAQTFTGAMTFANASSVFNGSGAGLTALNASNITTGTLADALHSSNIPRLNATNVFSALANRFAEVNVDAFETNNGTFSGGLLRLGGAGSGEGIASNRTSDANGNRYGIDFYTNGGTRRMSLTLGGDLGLGTPAPLGRVHVRTSGGSITDVNTMFSATNGLGSGALAISIPMWQSFSPNFGGSVTSIQTLLMLSSLSLPSFTCDLTATVYEGEGTGGTLLRTVTLSGVTFFDDVPVSAQFSISPPISVAQGQLYTVCVVPNALPQGQNTSFSWLGSTDNPEPRGRSRRAFYYPADSEHDLGIAVRSTVGPLNALVVTPGGDVGIGTSAPQTRLDVIGGILCDHVFERSSASLKHDIRPLEDPGALIEALAPSRYRLNDPARGGEDIGLIAEDVDKLLPELVAHAPDGTPIGIKYDRLSVVAIGALKSQSERLRRLERENAGLRERLDRLERAVGASRADR